MKSRHSRRCSAFPSRPAISSRTASSSRSDALARDYVHARRSHFRVLFRQILAMFGLQVAAKDPDPAAAGAGESRRDRGLGAAIAEGAMSAANAAVPSIR